MKTIDKKNRKEGISFGLGVCVGLESHQRSLMGLVKVLRKVELRVFRKVLWMVGLKAYRMKDRKADQMDLWKGYLRETSKVDLKE